MDETLDTLRARVAQIHGRYSAYFAGHPRITRDPSQLRGMVEALEALGEEAAALPADARATLLDELRARRALYEREAEAIAQAQAAGPDALLASHLASWVDFTTHRYRRRFAGQNRATRDLGLLSDLVEELSRLGAELDTLAGRYDSGDLSGPRQRVASFLTLCEEERRRIVEARLAGTLQAQADALAAVANEQFRLYRAHFAGESRLSRRPALMTQMVGTLTDLRDRMAALVQQGLHSDHNDKNLRIVTERHSAYTQELQEIRQAKQRAGLPALVTALGEAANAIFARYREAFAGEAHAACDLGLLDELCDGLYDLGRQMEELDRVRADPANQDNLRVVMDHLRLYERERDSIAEARDAAS